MTYAFTPPTIPTLPIVGSQTLFPVRRIYCIGRNFADHAIEMGHDPDREPPFFFQKNPNNIDISGNFSYPTQSNDVHHEIEMVVALKSGGTNIKLADALTHVFGYGVGLDMTRRDRQGEMKKMGRPWEIGKAFEGSAPMGPINPITAIGHPDLGLVELKVNGAVKQTGDLNQMIWKVPEMISYLSDYFTLDAGDLIMAGTPAGVGPVARGDALVAHVEGVGTLECQVV